MLMPPAWRSPQEMVRVEAWRAETALLTEHFP
jgi:hypothetical protein